MTDRHLAPCEASSVPEPRRAWVWPLPSIDGRSPAELEARLPRPGVDLAYARRHDLDMRATYRAGTRNGTKTHFMPDGVPALSSHDGFTAYAGKHGDGYAVIVDHENGWATYYTQLERMFATPTSEHTGRAERVKAGDVVGHVGSPGGDELKCLHFELWALGDNHRYRAVDPRRIMQGWNIVPWDERMKATQDARLMQVGGR